MNYQESDLTITSIDANTNFNLKDFNDRFSSIQDYINGTRAKVNDLNSNKVDKTSGKGLSTNDFNNTYKGYVDDLVNSSKTLKNGHTHTISQITDIGSASVNYATTAGSANSVAWANVTGKANLSDNNFTNTYKSYVDDLVNSSKTLKNGHTHSKLTFSNSSDGTTGDYDGSATKTIGYKSVLSTAQQNAVNSGITASKVSQYDGYNSLPDYIHFNIDSNQNTMEYVIRNYKPSYSVTLTSGEGNFTINNINIPECGAYIRITFVLFWGIKTYTTIIPGYGSYTKYILIEDDMHAHKGSSDNYALKDDYKDWMQVRNLGYLSYNKTTKTLTFTETGGSFFGPSSSYPHKLEVWNIANSFNLTGIVVNEEISYNVQDMAIGASKNVTLPYYKVLSASYLRVEYDGSGYGYTVSNFSTTSTSVSFKVTRSTSGGYTGTYARVIFRFSGIK